jgi:hypothetical protein
VALRVARVVLGAREAEVARVVDEAHAARVARSAAYCCETRSGVAKITTSQSSPTSTLSGACTTQVAAAGQVRVDLVDALAGVVTRDQLRPALEVRVPSSSSRMPRPPYPVAPIS